MDSFRYEFDAPAGAADGGGAPPPIEIEEAHDAIGHRVWDGAVLLGKFLEHLHAAREAVVAACAASGDGGGGDDDAAALAAAVSRLRFDAPTPAPSADACRVIDVGSGTGICAMMAARIAARASAPLRVVATDLPGVVPRLARNVAAVGVAYMVQAAPLPWGDADAAAAALAAVSDAAAWRATAAAPPAPAGVDVILACDLAGPPVPLGAALASTLATLLRAGRPHPAPPPILLLLCQSHRDLTATLLPALAAAGVHLLPLPPAALHPAYRSDRHTLYAAVGTTPAARP